MNKLLICLLSVLPLLLLPLDSIADKDKGPGDRAYEMANDNARFNRDDDNADHKDKKKDKQYDDHRHRENGDREDRDDGDDRDEKKDDDNEKKGRLNLNK
jgi:hypothetical protein